MGNQLPCALWGHEGSGGLHLRLSPAKDPDVACNRVHLRHGIQARGAKHGCSCGLTRGAM